MRFGIEKWNAKLQDWQVYGWYPTKIERDKSLYSLREDARKAAALMWHGNKGHVPRYRPIDNW